jgi:hypothetical protein
MVTVERNAGTPYLTALLYSTHPLANALLRLHTRTPTYIDIYSSLW